MLNWSVLRHDSGKRGVVFFLTAQTLHLCFTHLLSSQQTGHKHHSRDSRLWDLSVENLYPELEEGNVNYGKKQCGIKRNGLHIYFRRMIPRQECRKRSQYNNVTFLYLY